MLQGISELVFNGDLVYKLKDLLKSKEEGKNQESIQSSTTHDPDILKRPRIHIRTAAFERFIVMVSSLIVRRWLLFQYNDGPDVKH